MVAVTGASGFIGKYLCSDLLRAGCMVRAVTRYPPEVQPGVDAYTVSDLNDVDRLRVAFRGVDTVVHLAGRAHRMHERGNVDAAHHAVNVEGTRAVARSAADESVRQVIFASSVKAIGESANVAFRDDTPQYPRDAYGRSKLAAENVLLEMAMRRGFHAIVLRFPLVYGPGVKGNLRRLFDAVWRGLPIPVAGVNNARSLLGIDNLSAFISRLIGEPIESSRPFVLSDEEAVSTEELVRMIGRGLGRKPRLVKVPLPILRAVGAMGDVAAFFGIPSLTSADVDRLTSSLIVDSSSAWRAAGLNPPIPIEEGISRTASWFLSGGKSSHA